MSVVIDLFAGVILVLNSTKMWKYDIVHHLTDLNRYKSYLEICTPTSGLKYDHINQTKFENCHRLMYRCADNFNDGLNIDFRSVSNNLKDCVQEIRLRDLKYDIVFVDAFHSYEATLRDLKLATNLLNNGGSIVVHDCLPPAHASISPTFVGNWWGGVTFKAFVDFVVEQTAFNYFTVDTDWGCGVIQSPTASPGANKRPSADIVQAWSAIGADYPRAFEFLNANKDDLLNLISADEFLQRSSPQVYVANSILILAKFQLGTNRTETNYDNDPNVSLS